MAETATKEDETKTEQAEAPKRMTKLERLEKELAEARAAEKARKDKAIAGIEEQLASAEARLERQKQRVDALRTELKELQD